MMQAPGSGEVAPARAAHRHRVPREQRRAPAPVGQPLQDLYAYDGAYAQEQSATDLQMLGSISSTMTALEAVGDDLKQINKECGQSAGAYEGDMY